MIFPSSLPSPRFLSSSLTVLCVDNLYHPVCNLHCSSLLCLDKYTRTCRHLHCNIIRSDFCAFKKIPVPFLFIFASPWTPFPHQKKKNLLKGWKAERPWKIERKRERGIGNRRRGEKNWTIYCSSQGWTKPEPKAWNSSDFTMCVVRIRLL